MLSLVISCDHTSKLKEVETSAPLESLYLPDGKYEIKRVEYSSDDAAIGKIVVVYPATVEESSEKWPLVNIGNPSNTDADGMMKYIEHLASWGYVVIDNMDKQTGTGASVSKTLDEFLNLSQEEDNIFRDKVDMDRIAIAGYSQGAFATVQAATRFANSTMYKAVFLCSVPQPDLGEGFKWGKYQFSDLKAPVFMVCGTGQWDAKIICPFEKFTSLFDELPEDVPAVQARRTDRDHEQMGDESDPYMTAWFEYWLKGDENARAVFITDDAELLHNERWQDVRIRINK